MADDELEMNETLQDDSENSKPSANASSDEDANDESSHDDAVVSTSSAARDEMRKSMEDDVAAFLARGGQIQKIDDNVMADPPRKPQTNYGSRPI